MGNLRERGIVRSSGRITIPKDIREKLGIKEGTFYEMEVYGKDKILITVWVRQGRGKLVHQETS